MQEKLFDEQVVAVVGKRHPLAGKKSVTFKQIRPFGWILPPPETTLRRQIDQYFVSEGQYVPPTILESVSYLANRSLFQELDLIGLSDIDYYRAFQYWRLAAIIEGVLARYLKGVMGSAADTEAFRWQVDSLAEQALELIRRLR